MKRLAMMAVTGIMAFALGACGGDDVPPVPDANTDDMMQTQMQQPAPEAAPVAGAEAAAPSAEEMAGASAQE